MCKAVGYCKLFFIELWELPLSSSKERFSKERRVLLKCIVVVLSLPLTTKGIDLKAGSGMKTFKKGEGFILLYSAKQDKVLEG